MKIICVGRNYAAHAAEMKAEKPTEPVIFLKPDTALLKKGEDFYYPNFTKEIHYEAEIFFRVGSEGKYLKRKFALFHIDVLGLGIDFTARDLQQKFKTQGLPWELAKAFNNSAAVSEVMPIEHFQNLKNIDFELKINGETRQVGNTKDMIFDIEELVEFVSEYITLRTGDLIFTGTPAGVGPIAIGDHLEGFIDGKKVMNFHIK